MRLKIFVRHFFKEKVAFYSLIYMLIWFLIAIFASIITPYDAGEQNLIKVFQPPSKEHLFGTDQLGRDIFSRAILGSQTTFKAGFMAVLIPVFIGVPLGVLSGYFGGIIDDIFMRIVDGILSFPAILLALAITGVLGISLTNTMIAIGIIMTPEFARLARGQTKQIRSSAYIEASFISGGSSFWIMMKHIIPNIMPPLIVQISFSFSVAILIESGLSFLGLGAQSPQVSWGSLLKEAYVMIYSSPWMILFPAFAISSMILAGNFVGDGLRVALDPRVKKLES
jgi:peptide/nickel transport system permease protein